MRLNFQGLIDNAKYYLLGSALGFNVSKLLRLLGRGIFSHAPTVFGRFMAATNPLDDRDLAFRDRDDEKLGDPAPAPKIWNPTTLAENTLFLA